MRIGNDLIIEYFINITTELTCNDILVGFTGSYARRYWEENIMGNELNNGRREIAKARSTCFGFLSVSIWTRSNRLMNTRLISNIPTTLLVTKQRNSKFHNPQKKFSLHETSRVYIISSLVYYYDYYKKKKNCNLKPEYTSVSSRCVDEKNN